MIMLIDLVYYYTRVVKRYRNLCFSRISWMRLLSEKFVNESNFET